MEETKPVTNAELAILSLVAEQPRHGYEIEQVIEERGMRDWTEVGFSSIYYLLKKLEQERLIESRLEPAGRGPARQVYQATPAGNAALRAAVRETLSTPARPSSPLQLGLANMPALPRGEAVAALQQYRAELAGRLRHVRARQRAQQPLPYFVEAMFDHSITLIKAELRWADRFIAKLEDQDAQD
jgi:DNA-binding PadR family transcriptional regulator